MPTVPLLLNTITIKHCQGLQQRLQLAHNAGFSGCELWLHEVAPELLSKADRREASQRYGITLETAASIDCSAILQHSKLSVSGLCPPSHAALQWPVALDTQTLSALDATLRAAAEINASYVLLPILHPEATISSIATVVNQLCVLAAPYNIRLGLEPVGHVGCCNRIVDMLEVLQRIEADSSVGVIVDAFHFFRAGHDLSDLTAIRPEQIIAVHINDAIDLPHDQLLGHRHRTYPGTGIWDIEGFCRTLFTRAYQGPIVTEILNDDLWTTDAKQVCDKAYATSHAVVQRALDNGVLDNGRQS